MVPIKIQIEGKKYLLVEGEGVLIDIDDRFLALELSGTDAAPIIAVRYATKEEWKTGVLNAVADNKQTV